MSVHPDGSGTGWDEASPDINQPHGKDYITLQDLRKGVRKRLNKEHVDCADLTVGGEHVPGGCAIMDIVDASTDISAGDGTYVGHNIIWDQTNSIFWCFTADGTTSGAAYKMMLGPKSICSSGDYTWTGGHEFDASVDISGNVALDGDFSVDGTAAFTDASFDGTVDFAGAVAIGGDVSMAGTLKVATDLSLTGDMAVDGTVNFAGDVDFGSDSTVTFNGEIDIIGSDTSQDNAAADMADSTLYKANFTSGLLGVQVADDGDIICYMSDTSTDVTGGAGNERLNFGTGVGGGGITLPVAKNKYFVVDTSNTTFVKMVWFPFGAGSVCAV